MECNVKVEPGYIRVDVVNRETAEETAQFIDAILAALREHRIPKILLVLRKSRAIFKVGQYNLIDAFKAGALIPGLRIAHVSDSPELQASQDYIALLGRQHGIASRAFKDEDAALSWLLSGEPA
jgi:hypothetical protein